MVTLSAEIAREMVALTKYVLTADRTLMSEFRHIPNLDFLACTAIESMPLFLFRRLSPPVPHRDGIALRAPYGLRKVEACLLGSNPPKEVAVTVPDEIHRFLGPDTKVVGINTMEPIGLGPLTLLASSYADGGLSFAPYFFRQLIGRLRDIRKRRGLSFKIVVGGSGAWQFEFRPELVEEWGIDQVIVGEVDTRADELFAEAEEGDHGRIRRVRDFPRVDEMPLIRGAVCHDLVEVMRGCGRNCKFCEPNLRRARYYPLDRIRREVEVNLRAGGHRAWFQSEDIFLYALEDHREFHPNENAILDLFRMAMRIPGVAASSATHGTVAPAAAFPEFLGDLSQVLRAGPDKWVGIQTGIETGSPELMERIMPLKCKPYDPEEWADVVVQATITFNRNYWFPVYTLITGLPGETEEDVWATLDLVDRLESEVPKAVGKEKTHFWIGVFPFVPIGVMHGEQAFDLASMMTDARRHLFYRVYRHMIYEFTHANLSTMNNEWLSTGYRVFGPVGAWFLGRWIEKFARDQGIESGKAFPNGRPLAV